MEGMDKERPTKPRSRFETFCFNMRKGNTFPRLYVPLLKMIKIKMNEERRDEDEDDERKKEEREREEEGYT